MKNLIHTFNHTMEMMSHDQLEGMTSDQGVDIMMVNPNAANGYILGYNNGVQGITGTTTLDATKVLLDQIYNDTYLMNITKVDDTHYTIKSKVGNYGPTGTTDVASWSTDLMRYQISNAATILGPEDITTNINTENNPCMIRFTSPSGSFLNAGGDVSALKYATGTGAWSVWNLWLIDDTTPS